jgi:hypothetical protein
MITEIDCATYYANQFFASKNLFDKKLIDVTSHNTAFCTSVAEGSPMSSGSLLGFGSGRSFSI